MLERFLIVWLTLSSLLAYFWPRWFAGLPDVFGGGQPSLPYCIALTMFAVGSMLPKDEVRQVIARWPTVFGGTAIQYTAMPLLAYVFGRALSLESSAMIGIVIVGCVPGAMASNVLTLNARGNTSYSVSLTTAATLSSPVVVPLALVLLLGDGVNIDAWKVSLGLLLTVVLPVIVGHLVGRRLSRWESTVRWCGSKTANLAILWIIAVIVGLHREHLTDIRANMCLALLGVNLCGYAVGYVGGRVLKLAEPMRRALTLEVGMQNAGLGAVLATSFFHSQPDAAIAPAMYTFGCMFTGTLLASAWSRASTGSEPDDEAT